MFHDAKLLSVYDKSCPSITFCQLNLDRLHCSNANFPHSSAAKIQLVSALYLIIIWKILEEIEIVPKPFRFGTILSKDNYVTTQGVLQFNIHNLTSALVIIFLFD